jgi:hypothetical protein
MLRALMADGGHGDVALAEAVQCRKCFLPLAVSLRTPVLACATLAAAFGTPRCSAVLMQAARQSTYHPDPDEGCCPGEEASACAASHRVRRTP